jgi:hypothetical protein
MLICQSAVVPNGQADEAERPVPLPAGLGRERHQCEHAGGEQNQARSVVAEVRPLIGLARARPACLRHRAAPAHRLQRRRLEARELGPKHLDDFAHGGLIREGLVDRGRVGG